MIQALTSSLHEGIVHAEREQRFSEIAEKVLDDTTQHIDVCHLLKARVTLHAKETLLCFLDQLVRAKGRLVHNIHTEDRIGRYTTYPAEQWCCTVLPAADSLGCGK